MGWSDDPSCTGLYEPRPPRQSDFQSEGEFNDAFSDYLEEWFEWWGGCIEDEPEEPTEPEPPVPPPPPPPPCKPARWMHGKFCWERICTIDGPVVRPCRGKVPFLQITPRIQSICLGVNGYTVVVALSPDQEPVVQRVSSRKVKLLPIVRAMLHGSKLPASDVRKVSKNFWMQQKKIGRLSEFSIIDARGTPVKLLGEGSPFFRRKNKPQKRYKDFES